MLDIKFIRENSDLIKLAVGKKHLSFDVDVLVVLDQKRLETLKNIEDLKAKQNFANEKLTQVSAM